MELIKTKQNKKFSEFFLFINEKHPIKNLHSTAFQVSHRAPSAYLSCLKKIYMRKKCVRARGRERKSGRANERTARENIIIKVWKGLFRSNTKDL